MDHIDGTTQNGTSSNLRLRLGTWLFWPLCVLPLIGIAAAVIFKIPEQPQPCQHERAESHRAQYLADLELAHRHHTERT
jgi:hypothetical protein